jgi:iron complex outermembrane receptor protein
MKNILFIPAGFILFTMMVFSQPRGMITGMVSDSVSGVSLPGATVLAGAQHGVTTDGEGRYILMLEAGAYDLQVRFLGYDPVVRRVVVRGGDTLRVDFRLVRSQKMLSEVVVSADKFAQKLSEVNVSMTVLRPREMELDNPVSLDALLDKVSGVDILDGQPAIRGGSGYSYGAGSRVMVVVDGLPMISGDAGDVKWDFLPLETLSQVEVIKGASSVLYGSSALNGVINLRTLQPGVRPATMVRLYNGFYLPPKRKELVWWDKPRWWLGASAVHARTTGNTSLVAGGDLFRNTGYREEEYARRARLNLSLDTRSARVHGLSYGVAFNGMLVDKSDFFLWQNADSGAWRQPPVGISPYKGYRLYVDPHVRYTTRRGGIHSLKTRYFSVNNNMTRAPEKSNHFNSYTGEYRYQKRWGRYLFSAGLFENYNTVFSRLYGNHHGNETALYLQLHGKMGERFSFTAGGRYEMFRLDTFALSTRPVFRAGLNYRLFRGTHLRLSGGQGFRYPSVAEKFTATSIGALNIFPNPALQPEKGWSAELGVLQNYLRGAWDGFVDLSLFVNEYTDMIEFVFGMYPPDPSTAPSLKYVGFKALNVEHARITGLELQLHVEKKRGDLTLALHGGYVFLNPVDLNLPKGEGHDNILKYRYRHGVKGYAQLGYRNWSTGISLVYRSFMERVDSVFIDPFIGNLILPGYPDYREEHTQGQVIVDYRAGYTFYKALQVSVMCKNLFNREYMGRPGDLRPPRTLELQVVLRL